MTAGSNDMTWNSVCVMSVRQLWECHSDGGEFERDHPRRFLSPNDSLLCINALHHTLLTRNAASLTRCHPIYSHLWFQEGEGLWRWGWPLPILYDSVGKGEKACRQCGSRMNSNLLEKSRWGKKVYWGTPPFPSQPLCILEILIRPHTHTILRMSISLTFSASFELFNPVWWMGFCQRMFMSLPFSP